MAKVLYLDRYIKEGTLYKTKSRVAFIIERIGTNSSGDAYLQIEEKRTGIIDSTIAPIHTTSSNLLGPLDLGDLYYVIPPDTEFQFIGDSGSICRLIGKIILLDPGESLGSPYMSRFERQFDHYFTKYEATLTLATDEVFKADEERELALIKPDLNEMYKFYRYAGITSSGGTVSEGMFALTIWYDGKPFEFIETEGFGPGIDIMNMPLPPADSTNEIPFSFELQPLEVADRHELSLRIRNISGADQAPESGSAWSFTLKTIAEYIRK